MIVLEVLHGKTDQRIYEIGEPIVTIGRAGTNTVVLTDYHLSGEHCQIGHHSGRYVFRDLRSTNGSAIERGGARLAVDAGRRFEIELEAGDLIRLGDPRNPVVIKVSAIVERPPVESDDLPSDLIASRSIVDLPSVTHQIEHDPAGAVRVYKALQRLGARVDHQATLEACAEATFELLPLASHVALLVRSESDKDRFVLALSKQRTGTSGPAGVASTEPIRASRAVLRRVLGERAAVLMANAQEEMSASESILGGRIQAMIAVPMWRGDEIIGLIQADNRRSAGLFEESDLEVALLLGAHAALAIDNASLFQRAKIAEEKARGENVYLKRRDEKQRAPNIVGESPAMKAVLGQLDKVIDTRATVCIEGETGTGKELVASSIHFKSNRRDRMFVAQNCAALPENLLESELFGHKRGAFTSADADKKGLFEIADGGTLFLDEVGEMPLTLQAKILRVLQEGTIRPVGAAAEKQVDVRILCATNRDLAAEVTAGRFRQDLFYRLMVFPLRLPPLRERREDLPLLANHFLRRYSAEARLEVPGFTQEALDALRAYSWPGNIRELENEVQRVVIQAEPGHWIEVTDLSPRLRRVEGTLAKIAPKKGTLKEMVDEVERWLLAEALRENDNNKTRTAAQLGITREGLHKKLAKFGL